MDSLRQLHRHARAVRAICARRLRPRDVDDAVQEVFARAWAARDRLRDPERWGSYLGTIARNLCIDRLRRPRRRELPLHELVAEPPAPDRQPDVLASCLQERLRRGLSRLPDPRREVLTWFYLEGRSHDEIAAELGTTRMAVSQRLHRARRALRAAVAGELDRHPCP